MRTLIFVLSLLMALPATGYTAEPAGSAPDKGELVGVLCAWNMYIMAQSAIRQCTPNEKNLLRGVDGAITRMNEFIVLNSPKKMLPEEAARATNERQAFYGTRLKRDQEKDPQLCTKIRKDPLVDLMYRMGANGIKKDMDNLLSVARPPKMEPCW